MEVAPPVLRTIGLVGVHLSHLMGERRFRLTLPSEL